MCHADHFFALRIQTPIGQAGEVACIGIHDIGRAVAAGGGKRDIEMLVVGAITQPFIQIGDAFFAAAGEDYLAGFGIRGPGQ